MKTTKTEVSAKISENVDRFYRKNSDNKNMAVATFARPEEFTQVEKNIPLSSFSSSEKDIAQAMFAFDLIKTKAFFPSDEDLASIGSLLPEADIETFRQFRTKSIQGTCQCGRNLSVYDIVVKGLDSGMHSRNFLTCMLNGSLGRAVISGTDGPEHLKARMPKNTVWIENTSPIPCTRCGTLHDVSLSTPHILHNWVLAIDQ